MRVGHRASYNSCKSHRSSYAFEEKDEGVFVVVDAWFEIVPRCAAIDAAVKGSA